MGDLCIALIRRVLPGRKATFTHTHTRTHTQYTHTHTNTHTQVLGRGELCSCAAVTQHPDGQKDCGGRTFIAHLATLTAMQVELLFCTPLRAA